MYQALIFDLDGLLIDSETIYRKISYKMAADLGKQLHDGIWVKQMGRSPIESLRIFHDELGITTHTVQELVDLRNVLLLDGFRNELQIMPGALEIIRAFHGRMRMTIATGSPRLLMDLAIAQLGLAGYFEYMLPSDEIVSGKPDPEIYLKTIQALGLYPDECIVLEDSSNGALSGHRAGCYVIAVPSDYTRNQDFSFANHVAEDLFEARLLIEEL
ncbi:MAG: HAD family phosphatase [Porphyromonadaceae bacterium]|nr:MAG: HAD family phosphatase [Porphyromonadaceae bacterium]